MQERIYDARWQTRNTKLASALLCKGFTLASQPFITTAESGRETTTIYFLPTANCEGTEVGAGDIQKQWEAAASADGECAQEIRWMRAALYSRDFLINAFIHPKGKVPTSGQVLASSYRTDDLTLASCLHACGYSVLAFVDKRFYFPEAARGDAIYYGSRENPAHPMQWKRCVLLQQYELIGAIRNHMHAKVRTIKGPGTRQAILSANMPEPLLRQCLRELYKDK